MRIAIVGAGSVGRSIARELVGKRHNVLLIDKYTTPERLAHVPQAQWLQGDACEMSVLAEADLASVEVVVAATGDDKVNLVVSLLAKTEFGVPRTVARVSHPRNEWMFDDQWGVDVAVSTPRIMTSLVEEAVSVGRVVKIFEFSRSDTQMVEITLPETSPMIGRTVGSVRWTPGCVLVGIIRDGKPVAPTAHDALEERDELLFLAEHGSQEALQKLLVPREVEATTASLPVVKPSSH
ncbi:potassium channel family protein [Devriesea agamarum]|uniref:potassium channel family protein n=1 Tax=Devriesea agamarum TaxID=472569 RepID=UPI00071D62DE|nr:TrkA family potassium uptake protein [Devriesea agamarum]